MSRGLDTISNCVLHAEEIKKAGYNFVGRYYNVNDHNKNLTLSEAKALSSAGLSIIAVWENGFPTKASYFSNSQGINDGKDAYNYALKTIGQPANTPIYFTVDYDASESDISGVISEYFKGISEIFSKMGSHYKIGIYGSGAACAGVMKNNKNVTFAWLTQSTGWTGTKAFTDWNIKQGPDKTLFSINFDTNEGNVHDGSFKID
jgi:hypothetical protein